jgi:hypothetical protein
VADEVLNKRLALIEEQTSRVERGREKIVPGGDPELESRLESLIRILEKSRPGTDQPADKCDKEAKNAESSRENPGV